MTREQFPLPTLGPVLEAVREEVVNGRGFALIRGVPVERYSRQEVMIAYWGIGRYWGKAVSNNKKGHLIGHIKVSLLMEGAAQGWLQLMDVCKCVGGNKGQYSCLLCCETGPL